MNQFCIAATGNRRDRGFSLIELMVGVAIVGILAAIAFPSYTEYVKKGNRAAAQSYLMTLSTAQTTFLADVRAYADLDELVEANPIPDTVAPLYKIELTLSAGPPQSYVITATPKTGTRQADDYVLTIDSSGARTPSDKW